MEGLKYRSWIREDSCEKFPSLLNYCGLVALMICLFKCVFVQNSSPDRLTGISQLKQEELGWFSAHPHKSRSDPL